MYRARQRMSFSSQPEVTAGSKSPPLVESGASAMNGRNVTRPLSTIAPTSSHRNGRRLRSLAPIHSTSASRHGTGGRASTACAGTAARWRPAPGRRSAPSGRRPSRRSDRSSAGNATATSRRQRDAGDGVVLSRNRARLFVRLDPAVGGVEEIERAVVRQPHGHVQQHGDEGPPPRLRSRPGAARRGPSRRPPAAPPRAAASSCGCRATAPAARPPAPGGGARAAARPRRRRRRPTRNRPSGCRRSSTMGEARNASATRSPLSWPQAVTSRATATTVAASAAAVARLTRTCPPTGSSTATMASTTGTPGLREGA